MPLPPKSAANLQIRASASFLEEFVDSGSPFGIPSITVSGSVTARATRIRSPLSPLATKTHVTRLILTVFHSDAYSANWGQLSLYKMSVSRSPRSSEDVSEERGIASGSRPRGSGTVGKSTDPARLWTTCLNRA